MIRTTFTVILSIVLLAGLALPGSAQPIARRVSIADVTATVLQNNLQLRAAAFDVATAQSQLAEARGGQLPQVGLSAAYTRNQDQPGGRDPNLYASGLIVSYPLYSGGRVEAQVRLAEAALRGALATYDRTKQQVVYSADQIYLQGLLATENVAAAQRALAAATESLRVARARFGAGVAAQFDVLQAEVAVANAEQTLVQAETGVASAQASLNAALNLSLDTALELTDTLTPRPVEGTQAEAIARALRDRSDLVALRSRIEAAQAGIDLARSGGLPYVSLGAGYSVGNANGLSPYVFGGWLVSLGVTL